MTTLTKTTVETKPIPELPLHPLCEIIPPCTEAEFKELKEDIKKNGLQVPIKLFVGQILDGRSRYKACIELGIEPKTEIFAGSSQDALAYVISMNVKRRHLSASQRAILAAQLVSWHQRTANFSPNAVPNPIF